MPPGPSRPLPLLPTVFFRCAPLTLLLAPLAQAGPAPPSLRSRDDDPLNINWGPAPPPADGPPLSAGALRDKSYLPAQIGGIVGAYALSLVLVAITLLSLAKKRRRHLDAATDEVGFEEIHRGVGPTELHPNAFKSLQVLTHFTSNKRDGVPNFSYPSPTKSEFYQPTAFTDPSPASSLAAPGTDYSVDQAIVAADRAMAQQQLEDMYKYVMEHEDAKERGITLDAPAIPGSGRQSTSSSKTNLSKKEKTKPANLNLSGANEEKSQSRTSSLLSALRSPKKKPKGVSISSPIMTPQSATFPRREQQDMGAIPPRHYAPPPPPPVPTDQAPFAARARGGGAPLTPDISPESVQSIDERMGAHVGQATATATGSHYRNVSQAPTEGDPESAVSENSQAPLVPLPSSPKPGARFPSLPSSPKPGATFQRSNPSAVRTGGTLPLRAYEPAMASPSAVAHTTKQTVFERKGPLSPSGRTPYTAGATPYSPYQPFTPVMPVTPGLVTKEDRKRMKRMVPKTPTMEMVKSAEDIW